MGIDATANSAIQFNPHPGTLDRVGAWSKSGSDSFAYLTPDALITYCQINLRSIDEQVDKFMAHQKSSLAERKAFQSVTDFMKMKYDANGPKTHEEWMACANKVQELMNGLPPDDPRMTELGQLRDALGHGEGPAEGAHVQHWKDMQDGLSKMTDDIKSGSELEMVELQSLISQRQTAVQLTTGILAKLNESLQAIAQKI